MLLFIIIISKIATNKLFFWNIFCKVSNNIIGDNMHIKDVMSKSLIIGSITNSIAEIATMMKKYDIGFMPISDQKKIIGVITDRDIVVNALSNNCSQNDIIDKYIIKNIISIEQDKKIEDAIKLMGEKKVRRLIVTHDNKMTGILSLADIIKSNECKDLIIDNLQKIFEINRNDDLFKTEIDEFYL